jgi:PEP-CTERM motif
VPAERRPWPRFLTLQVRARQVFARRSAMPDTLTSPAADPPPVWPPQRGPSNPARRRPLRWTSTAYDPSDTDRLSPAFAGLNPWDKGMRSRSGTRILLTRRGHVRLLEASSMSALKLSAVVLALSAVLTPAMAADQMIDLSSGQASFDSLGPILAGGDDVITFTGLAPGLYDFTFSVSAQFINGFGGTLNGTPFSVAALGPITAGAAFGVDSAPFTLVLTGVPTSARSIYSGEITVSAIPEPGTYALLAAGLGIVGLVARRRRQG